MGRCVYDRCRAGCHRARAEAVLADSSFDIMGEVQPRVREAMGAKIDNAILFGGERPTEWTTDVLTLAAKNKVTGPIDYAKLLGKDGLFSKVEAGGFGVDAVVGDLTAKAELRGLVDTTGRPLFRSDMQGATTYALDGAPMYFPDNGGFDASKAQLDRRQLQEAWCTPSVRTSP